MSRAVAALAFGLLAGFWFGNTYDPAPPTEYVDAVRDPYQPVWSPAITTDCESWFITQSGAALEDLWPNDVDHMRIAHWQGEFGPGDRITVPRYPGHGLVKTDDGFQSVAHTFRFRWVRDDGQTAYGPIEVRVTGAGC